MPKAIDVVRLLMARLPKKTSRFSAEANLVAVETGADFAIATTEKEHGLKVGDYVLLQGTQEHIPIHIITRHVGPSDALPTYLTVSTKVDHDLTFSPNYKGVNSWPEMEKIEIVGAKNPEFNGVFPLLSVPNRLKFTCEFPNRGALSELDSPGFSLVKKWGVSLNDWLPVAEILSPRSFKVALPNKFGEVVLTAESKVSKPPRITGSLSIEHFAESYEPTPDGKYWAVVTLGDVTSSRTQTTRTDADYVSSNKQEFMQGVIRPFSVYVVCPVTDKLSLRDVRDEMEDMSRYLNACLLNEQLDGQASDKNYGFVTFKGHGVEGSSNSKNYYIHQFLFETFSMILNDDLYDRFDGTRAFRDIDLSIGYGGESSLRGNINLDDDAKLGE